MAADDYMDEKVGVAVAASALVFSPKVRNVLHRGAVLGVSGVLAAADVLSGFIRGIRIGATNGGAVEAEDELDEEQEPAASRGEGSRSAAARRRRRQVRAGVP
jgi:hypothetical protein